MVKRAQAHIDTALRELTPGLEGGQPAYLPAAAMVPTVEIPLPLRAAELVERVQPEAPPPAEPGRRLFDSPSDRYESLMSHRAGWTEADAAWLARYAASPDYAELSTYYADRGLAWEASESGFKTAG